MLAPRWTSLALGLLALGACLAGVAHADGQVVAVPVLIDQLGPKTIQFELAATEAGPCEDGALLYKGWLPPGHFRLDSPKRCVCWRQTYDDFPDVDWSPPRVTCLPKCWRGRFCTPPPRAFLSIGLRSPE